MNRDDDFIAQLEDYLDTFDGVVPLPASVRSAVQARVPGIRQVRGTRGPERILLMVSRISAPARLGLGAAAVLALVVLGAAALNLPGGGPDVGSVPTVAPSASPSTVPATPEPATPEPSTSPSASAGIPGLPIQGLASCGEGLQSSCVPPGTYRLGGTAWPATITLTLPEGWFTYGLEAFDFQGLLVEHRDATAGSGWGLVIMGVGEVFKDPCDGLAGKFPAGDTATVEGLVTAMQSWPGFEVSDPEPIEVTGYNGVLVDATSTRSVDDCRAGTIWTLSDGSSVDAYPMVGRADAPRPGTFRILEVEGKLVVIRTTDFGDPSPFELEQGIAPDRNRHVEDQAELTAIIASITITP